VEVVIRGVVCWFSKVVRAAEKKMISAALDKACERQPSATATTMASKHAAESLLGSSRCLRHRSIPIATQARPFSSLLPLREDLQTQTLSEQSQPPPASKAKKVLTPDNVVSRRQERSLWLTQSKFPIGSRRRRVALQHTTNIPFEQLPYQCFQEARKVLAADREEKVAQIEETRRRIAKLEAEDPKKIGGERAKMNRLESMKRHLEELKVLADVNDPIVKKMFEDGLGKKDFIQFNSR
jgi:large subunit ribosomal protein L35